MSTPYRATLSVRYTPPGGPQITPQFVVNGEATAQSVGRIDIPESTSAETVFPVPFGAVNQASFLMLRNLSGQEIGIRFGEADADEFTIRSGAVLMLAMDTIGEEAGELDEMNITTTAVQAADGYVEFLVFGDAATPPAP